MPVFPIPHSLCARIFAALLLCGALSAAAPGGEEYDINEIPLSVIHDVMEEFIAEGNLTAAEKGLAVMTAREPDNPYTLNVRGQLALAKDNFAEASTAWNRLLETASGEMELIDKAIAYCNLGVIHLKRGDLDSAEALFRTSLELNGAHGSPRVMADTYGNLGVISGRRGDFVHAQELHEKALALHSQSDNKAAMIVDYVNLADICKRRGEWLPAAKLLRKAQEIAESLGNKKRASELQLEIMSLAIPMHEQRMREQRRK